MKKIIETEIIDEREIPSIRPENQYDDFHQKLVDLKEGKALKVSKKSLNLKNPRAGLYTTIRRRSTFQVSISQNKDFVFIKKIK